MNKQVLKHNKKARRKNKIRAKISGTAKSPRLNVSKSNQSVYVQLINDERSETLVAMHSKKVNKGGSKTELGYEVGREIAKRAQKKEIKKIVFDRGGNKYHGRVEAVARGAREGGLDF